MNLTPQAVPAMGIGAQRVCSLVQVGAGGLDRNKDQLRRFP
jgi:hypothetical protein